MVKLCLGTANVGSKYGIKKFKLSKNKVSNILKIALSEKIYNIDSSFEYKNSHKELSKIINNKFKVNTKTFLKKKIVFHRLRKKSYILTNTHIIKFTVYCCMIKMMQW